MGRVKNENKTVHDIRMADVTKVYDTSGTVALDGVTIDVTQGEFVFLVGPSGSGKTTLIKLLTGEVTASSGKVMVNDFDMTKIRRSKLPKVRRTLGTVFQGTVLRLIGARTDLVSEQTVRNAAAYLRFILCGAPFMCLSCVLNNQMRFQGNAFFSMIGLVSGAVLNVALDPILIFGAKMGVAGAALATSLSQAVGCMILYVGTRRSDSLNIRVRNFRPTPYYLKNIVIGGVPSLCRQGLASVAALCLNAAAGASVASADADAAIAAFSIVGKIMMLAFSALIGFGQAFQPVCGFNYGAARYDRVREAYVFCLKVGFAFLFAMSCIGFAFADGLVALFRDDPRVIAFGAVAMRCQCCTFTLMALVTITNMLYQNIGRVVGATVLAVARQGLMFIPVVLILPHVISPAIWGVYLAQPVSDLFAFSLAVPLAVKIIREFKQKENQ
jgi:Na+-driven multidrug efflux pump